MRRTRLSGLPPRCSDGRRVGHVRFPLRSFAQCAMCGSARRLFAGCGAGGWPTASSSCSGRSLLVVAWFVPSCLRKQARPREKFSEPRAGATSNSGPAARAMRRPRNRTSPAWGRPLPLRRGVLLSSACGGGGPAGRRAVRRTSAGPPAALVHLAERRAGGSFRRENLRSMPYPVVSSRPAGNSELRPGPRRSPRFARRPDPGSSRVTAQRDWH